VSSTWEHNAWQKLWALAWLVGCGTPGGSDALQGKPVVVADAGRGRSSGDAASADAASATTLDNGCPSHSGFPGDELCLPAPAPDQGFQLHYGPTDYADPANVAPYLLSPGKETVDCDYMKTPNAKDAYVSGYRIHMRRGSHHLLANLNPAPQADGLAGCQSNDMSPGPLAGSQTPVVDELIDPAPENEGLAVRIPANSQAVVNLHFINTGAMPVMREAWLNYLYIDPARVKGIRGNIFLVGGLGFHIEPGTSSTYKYSCSPDRPVRILSLAAHMHAHGTRLSAWKVSNDKTSLVYESFDWAEPALLKYDSTHANAASDRGLRIPGGASGTLRIEPGESLQWECAVDNTSNRPLTFQNEVYTGEMCILAGTDVAADDPMKPYDFKCTRN
jgi:hypothetical protein